ncbi:helix-turn-helix transcriptional regulator [Vibrio scophthalmi]|uniref:helix-turn-helix transcriptional regulator n=1 Tax=Vibrio scophthalmi TaxID=45658 RepID=UPI003872AE07
MVSDFSTQLPIFWFNCLDAAIKERTEESAEIWGGEQQYLQLCSSDSVSAYQLEYAVTELYQRYGDELIALFGQTANYFDELEQGAPVLAMLTAPTLHAFCDLFSRYSFHIHPLLKIICRETEHGELELWTITQEYVDEITLMSHLSLGLYLSVILKLIRRYLKAPSLRLPIHINRITIAGDITPLLEQVFNIEVKSGYAARYFLFNPQLVDRAHRRYDPELHEHLKVLAEQQSTQSREHSIICKVNDVFKRKEVVDITLDSIAQELHMSGRTLNRKLQQEGVSFRRLYDKYRLEQSLNLLNQANVNITQVALELGFSDSSAFTRAFKRWTGETPTKRG